MQRQSTFSWKLKDGHSYRVSFQYHLRYILCTDKKEKGNSEGSTAKSYMTNGLLIYGEKFAHFLIYWEALPHIWLCIPSEFPSMWGKFSFLFYQCAIVSTKHLLCNAAISFCQDTQDCRARAAHRATSVTARAHAWDRAPADPVLLDTMATPPQVQYTPSAALLYSED